MSSPEPRPTLAQVAKQANVSVTTASLALSNKGRISDEVRDRVKRAADALAYSPRAKRRTKTGVTAVLGFIDQEWAYSWSMQLAVLRGITRQLAVAGNRSACVVPVEASDSAEQIIARIKAVQADSVFSIHYAERELILGLEAEEIPVVIIMNNEFQTEFTSVCVDDFHGAYDACSVLVQARHERIAYI
ncbi:MAG: LacI family DNA-binding transcriptional regulator, partial [Spirochaetales bacterium]